jgi:hypothetical protein
MDPVDRGAQDPREPDALDVWGPYRNHIEDSTASCADYLGRIRKCLQGDVRPSRHYIADKAQALRDAADRLRQRCHDVEGWLKTCLQVFSNAQDDGSILIDECTLPAGHAEPHASPRPASPLIRAREAAQELAERSVALADSLAWWSREPWQVLDADDLSDLRLELGDLRRRLTNATQAIDALEALTERGAG